MRERLTIICIAAIILVGICEPNICFAQEAKAFFVSGKAFMPDGSPAVGAHVEARNISRGSDWKAAASATSGADGKFTMQLAKGDYRFCGASGNFAYIDQKGWISVNADGSLSRSIEIRLEKGCIVDGSVIDKSTGRPLGGVKIITRDGDTAESSEFGAWSMVLRKGGHAITAVKEGYWWPIVNFSASLDTVKVKVETKPGGTIKGRVVDDQGKPIAGVQVGTDATGYFSEQKATTDSDGRFNLPGQDPDSRTLISASADDYNYLRDQPVTFAAGQRETQVELVLKKTPVRTISGCVTRPDGSPIEGAKVGYGAGANWVDYTSAKTDKDGKFTLKKASIRRNMVVASCNGYAPAWKVVEADKTAQLDFQLKPGHAVEGRIEDEDGSPISGAGLTIRMETRAPEAMDNLYVVGGANTDKDGKFKLENLPEGFVYAGVYAPGYDSLENERLKTDRKDCTLVMRKTVKGQICGTIVKESDGKPVPEFNIRLEFSRKGGGSSGLAPGLLEQGVNFQPQDGKFEIKGLGIKEGYAVVVTAPGYLQARVDPVFVKPVSDNTYKDLVIRLRPAGGFEGSVTDAGTGKPIEGIIITAWDTASYGSDMSFRWDMGNTSLKSVSFRTDANGKFYLDSMPFASGAVQLEKQGYARTLLRGISFSQPLQADLRKGGAIAGSIADKQGSVPPGTWLNIENVDQSMSFDRPKINSDGSFRVEDLPAGEYIVLQYKQGQNSSSAYQSFDLKAGETYLVDWVQKGSVTVEGKILRGGKPVPGVRMSVNSNKKGMNWVGDAESGADGSYKLTLLRPGKYLFSCMVGEWTDPNKIRVAKTLDLAAGTNRADFNLPCGSISGKLVDKLTGKPLAGQSVRFYVWETYEQNMGRESLYSNTAGPTWWPSNECKTDKNGIFTAKNLRAGKWLICGLSSGERPRAIPAGVVTLADGEVRSGVVAKVPQMGAASFSITGLKGHPEQTMIVCIDDYGMIYNPRFENGAYTMDVQDLPVGTLKAVVRSSAYLSTQVPFQVKAGETSNVSIKLIKGSRIIFKPKMGSSAPASPVSIAFRISTPDGKPVWQSWQGLSWGDVIESSGPDNSASIAIKPGIYLVKAAARDDRNSWRDESNLTGWSGTIKVESGKDTIVEIPCNK